MKGLNAFDPLPVVDVVGFAEARTTLLLESRTVACKLKGCMSLGDVCLRSSIQRGLSVDGSVANVPGPNRVQLPLRLSQYVVDEIAAGHGNFLVWFVVAALWSSVTD